MLLDKDSIKITAINYRTYSVLGTKEIDKHFQMSSIHWR